MRLRDRKRLGKLAEELEKYDFILATDESLTSALQEELEDPVVVTPERLAGDGEYSHVQEIRELFAYIVSQTDFTWKQSTFLLNNVIDCWKKDGSMDSILDYDLIEGEQVETILDHLSDFDNIYSKLEEFELSNSYDVAVIDSYSFNELQKSILPENYDEFSLLSDTSREMEEFNIFNSSNQIVESLIENFENLSSEECAVVIDKDSDIIHSIYASLEARNIEYVRDFGYSESEDLREFISLVELAISHSEIRYKDIKYIVDEEGFRSPKYDNYLFDSLKSKQLKRVKEFLNVAELLTFEEVAEEAKTLLDIDTAYLKDLIELHDLKEDKVSLDKLNKLKYYIRVFENDYESTNEGILFIDAKNPVFTDREHVFYIGMDSDWTKSVKSKPWIKKDLEQKKNIKDFKRFLQLGKKQHYMVQNFEGGEKIVPCLYFSEIIDEEYEGFTDFPHKKVKPSEKNKGKGFEKTEDYKPAKKLDKISQSSLNTFVMSPRLYYFSRVIHDADRKEMTKGNLFHDFAELYVNNKDFVESKENEYFVEAMYEELEKFIDPVNKSKVKTELLSGIKALKKYLNSEKVIKHDYDEEVFESKSFNIFKEKLDIEIETNLSEMSFKDDELGVEGKVDLIKTPTHLVDYKSGRKYSAKQIVDKSNPKLLDEDEIYPNFQAILYLSKLRKHQSDKKLKFTFFHLLEDLEEDINNGVDLENKITTITYYPKTFEEKLTDIEVFELLIKDVKKSNNRRKTLEKLNYKFFKKFMSENEVPEFLDKEETINSEFTARFINYAKSEVGDYKYVEKGCKSTVKKLVEFRKTNYFKEDLDNFEKFVETKLEELNTYRQERFPIDVKNPDELPNRDLIVGENGSKQ